MESYRMIHLFFLLSIICGFKIIAATQYDSNGQLSLEERRRWKSLLPNTTIPQAIENILSAGKQGGSIDWEVSAGKTNYGKQVAGRGGSINWEVSAGKTNYGKQAAGRGGSINWEVSAGKTNYGKQVAGRGGSINWEVSAGKTNYGTRGVGGTMKHNLLADDVYFSYKDVKVGTTFSLKFPKITQQKFSADEIDISSINQLPPTQAEAVEETIRTCEKKEAKNETKKCITSLDEMLVFVTKEIGRQVLALSTEFQDHNRHNYNIYSNYTVAKLKKITSSTSSNVACHLLPYPKVLFYCHRMSQTRVFQAALAGEDGTNLMSTMIVCHMDTSTWSPDHIAFKQIHLTPSSATSICHILLETDVIWVSTV